MFFTFQNPASEHAQAFVDFYHYVFFFLILIIIFIVWLLKLILIFGVLNNDLIYIKKQSQFSFFLIKMNMIYLKFIYNKFITILQYYLLCFFIYINIYKYILLCIFNYKKYRRDLIYTKIYVYFRYRYIIFKVILIILLRLLFDFIHFYSKKILLFSLCLIHYILSNLFYFKHNNNINNFSTDLNLEIFLKNDMSSINFLEKFIENRSNFLKKFLNFQNKNKYLITQIHQKMICNELSINESNNNIFNLKNLQWKNIQECEKAINFVEFTYLILIYYTNLNKLNIFNLFKLNQNIYNFDKPINYKINCLEKINNIIIKNFFKKTKSINNNNYFWIKIINANIKRILINELFLNFNFIKFFNYKNIFQKDFILYKNIFKNSSTNTFQYNNLNDSIFYSKFFLIDLNLSPYLFIQNFKHKQNLEWIWTSIPAFIILIILYPSLLLLYGYDKPHVTKPYLTFKIIGNQWYWSYEYSDNSILLDSLKDKNNKVNWILKNFQNSIKFDSYLINEDDLQLGQLRLLEVDRRIILPVGVCVRLIVTSADVLHSWAVPSLGIKIDAIPGRLNQFWLVLNKPGVFYGQCSEICGVNHAFMPIAVEGVFLDQYYDYLLNYFN